MRMLSPYFRLEERCNKSWQYNICGKSCKTLSEEGVSNITGIPVDGARAQHYFMYAMGVYIASITFVGPSIIDSFIFSRLLTVGMYDVSYK